MNRRYAPALLVSLTALPLLANCGGDSGPGGGSGGGLIDSTGGTADSGNGGGLASGGQGIGGTPTGTGGATSAGGGSLSGDGGSGPTSGGSGGGSTTTGGGPNGGGTGDGGSGAGGPDVDAMGKSNASVPDTTTVAQDYLRLGEIRILNNNWGSEDLGCGNSSFAVFVGEDRSFGWDFSRGDCADNGNPGATPVVPPDTSHPDFPQVEFGIHPFGIGDELVTSPEFSSTTLLPLQLKDITSASVTLDSLNITNGNLKTWNLAMEFWLSEGDPRQPSGSVNVHTELMAWWGWQNGRWPCDVGPETVQAGTMGYTLCHQRDDWADGWRYYQFRAGDGSDGNIKHDFTGTVDVKAFVDYLIDTRGYSPDLWMTRMEVGTEIDDDTSGRVSMKNVTFEVNGESRSPQFSE